MKSKTLVYSFLILALFVSSASAHAGKTDANGGHYNRATGEYHFHHGYSAHQHTGGVCPYDFDDQTGINSGGPSSGSSQTSTNQVFDKDSYSKGYDAGYSDGHDVGRAEYEEEINDKLEAARSDGYTEGYAKKSSEADKEIKKYKSKLSSAEEVSSRKSIYNYSVTAICIASLYLWSKDRKRLSSLEKSSSARIFALENQYKNKSSLLDDANNKLRSLHSEHRILKRKYEEAISKLDSLNSHQAGNSDSPHSKLLTFGHWPPEIHHSQKQLAKYRKAKTEKMRISKISDSQARVTSSSGAVYTVSLDSCTCPDFVCNEQRQAPCKHIYFAALRVGIPLGDIFRE